MSNVLSDWCLVNRHILEGVELLCLVDKGTDACRYLQTYGNWELATWLAKVSIFLRVMKYISRYFVRKHCLQRPQQEVVMSFEMFPKILNQKCRVNKMLFKNEFYSSLLFKILQYFWTAVAICQSLMKIFVAKWILKTG